MKKFHFFTKFNSKSEISFYSKFITHKIKKFIVFNADNYSWQIMKKNLVSQNIRDIHKKNKIDL